MPNGEYYDLRADKLNVHAGPLSGGSKVLLTGEVTPRQCFALGYCAFAISMAILLGVLPRHCWPLGFVLLTIAHQYSAPPFKLNHRGLGELGASSATNLFLPMFAVLLQTPLSALAGGRGVEEEPWSPWVFFCSLAVLVVPSFFLKVSLFLALNMEDRRADWLGGKYTVPVLLGEEIAARILGVCNILAYVSAIGIYFMGLCHSTTLIAILMSAPKAISIALAFNPSFRKFFIARRAKGKDGKTADSPEVPQRPYRLQGLVLQCLKHAPGVVLAVFADTLLRELIAAGSISGPASVSAGGDGRIDNLRSWLTGVVTMLWSSSLPLRYLPLIPFIYTFLVKSPARPPPRPSAEEQPAVAADDKVIIVGGGIGGLVLGACLHELRLPFEVLEKSPSGEMNGGADLALWPAATKILKELGVGSAEPADSGFVNADFWERKTYPVHLVRMAKVVPKPNEVPSPASDSSPGDGGSSSSVVSAPEEVLTTVDMDAVVDGEGQPFQLVGREALMSSLLPLLPGENIHRGVRVSRAEQVFLPGKNSAAAAYVDKSPTLRSSAQTSSSSSKVGHVAPGERRLCRVLVGADGIHSVCRPEVSATAAAVSAEDVLAHERKSNTVPAADAAAAVAVTPRYGGEVCYRGVLDLREGSTASQLRPLFEEDEWARPESMSVVYGDRIRYSWGFIDSAQETGYWFVKQLADKERSVTGSGSSGGKGRGPSEMPVQGWPEPLRTFARLTDKGCTYAHRIQDRPPIPRWSCSNITLLGDACHPATPNNGQGACMAIEDALVLATLLAEYWDKPDGHVEAFYLYERARLEHTRGVQRESYKQMKLGQLTSAVGIWVREFAIRNIPSSVLQKKLRAANVFDIEPWLLRFRALKANTRPSRNSSRT